MTTNHPSARVLKWLNGDSDVASYHLNPLNLAWSDEGPEHDLQRFAVVATRLESDMEYWSELIRADNWRYTLIGCVCLLLRRPSGKFEDLLFRLERGNMVSPQICMTMGIAYPRKAIDALNSFLDRCEKKDFKYRPIAAAHSVLEKLGVSRADSPDLDDLDRRHEFLAIDQVQLAKRIIAVQWDFWVAHSGDPIYAR